MERNTISIDKYLSPFVLNSDELFEIESLCQTSFVYQESAIPPSLDTTIRVTKGKTLYKPQKTRGHGENREGYCEECKEWFRLKTSSYWYHMNYKHGINSHGVRYPEPEVRVSNCKIEGYCQACDKWVVIGNKSNVKSIKFGWYKHWQKTHGNNMTI
ncbi:Meiotic expression up-regulated protein 26 [Nosema bombycis CQ1]|uniref:Meiotic expression up-regulated protein 26 n=1 Tax=Nosema bombycis (strain CQ1 / CVCC 102059) TaxID=578461 RepID=R0M9Z0_NOSB1|nr:Meiotic expression up-regulated protein 26 [Nosema bombycis CQ1]|eukprot:EOB14784.1 Meiotic expression up-regulated protein 26 [Nosema bombycis CQ1]